MIYPLLTDDDAKLCGIGEGPTCCAYLHKGGGGYSCARYNENQREWIDSEIFFGDWPATRQPLEAFPACQNGSGVGVLNLGLRYPFRKHHAVRRS